MTSLKTAQALAFLLLAVACGSSNPPPMQSDGGAPPADGGACAMGTCPADGGPVEDGGVDYPPPPYGKAVGNIVMNHSFLNHEGKMVRLSDYYKKAKAIVLNSSAGWCGVCKTEAAHLQSWYVAKKDKGLMVLGTLFETNTGAPATQSYASASWRDLYRLTYEVLIDPFFEMGIYYDESSTPLNMIINGDTMMIEYIVTGFGAQAMEAVIDSLLN